MLRGFFTTGDFFTTPYDLINPNSGSGDGLMIRAQGNSLSNLEMFTALQGTTHIRWGLVVQLVDRMVDLNNLPMGRVFISMGVNQAEDLSLPEAQSLQE